MYNNVRVLISVPMAAALLSCGGGGGDVTPPPPPPPVDLNAVAAITVTAPAATLATGRTMLLSAQATNSAGTVLTGQTFVWSTSNSAIATVEQNGTLLAVAPGSVDVAAAIGAKNNKVTLTITPPPVATSIAVNAGNGQSATINTAVSAPPSVIVKDAAGDPVSGVTVTFAVTQGGGTITGATQVTNAAGIATVGGWTLGPNPGPQAATATSGTLSGSPVTFTATATPLPSNMRQFNVTTSNGCQSIQLRTGEVKAQTQHVTIVADISNPSGGFTDADYQTFATTVESLHWPVLTENFGVPSDINNDGRIVAFFTSAVNALTPPNVTFFVGGFFFARDLLPRVRNDNIAPFDCPGSNETEMFYLLAPDPAGSVNGNVRSTNFVRTVSLGTIGHEMQHLINASRRIYVTNANSLETLFMEEGLAHIAEELLFYEASGLRPRSNIASATIPASGAVRDAFTLYATANSNRFRQYLLAPAANSPYRNDDGLPTRGATWSWLRYLADRGSAPPAAGPTCAATIALALNGTCRLDGAAAAQLTIDGGSGGSEYTIVAFNDGDALTLASTAANTISPTGPPTPSSAPTASFSHVSFGGLQQDTKFHDRLRAIERREVTPRMAHARARFGRQGRGLPLLSRSQAQVRASASAAYVEPVWGRLVNRNAVGLENLKAEFGQDILGAARDWAVAHYTDDAVPVTQSEYTHPSWNFRSVISPFPLPTQGPGGAPITLTAGGATYYRLGIAASTAGTVTFNVNAAAPPANLKLVVVRTK